MTYRMNQNASVRNLPPAKMAEIRHMFEKKDETSSTPIPAPRTDNRVGRNNEQSGVSGSPVKQKRPGRSPIRPPLSNISPLRNPNASPSRNPNVSPTRNLNVSPTRKANMNVNAETPVFLLGDTPSRKPAVSALTPGDSTFTPKPRPRSSIEHKGGHPSAALQGLSVGKLGQVAGVIALSEGSASDNRVSRLIGQLEHNVDSSCENSETKETDQDKTNSKTETPVYSRLWDGKEQQQSSISEPNVNKDIRPVSVFERLKMFDNISQASHSPSPGKPAKPPPPVKKSIEGQRSAEITEEQAKTPKVRPLRPPVRQRSLVEKTQETSIPDIHKSSAIANDNTVTKKPLLPPSKPPRTGAHDDYVRVKKEKEAETQQDSDDYIDCDFVVIPKDKPDTKTVKTNNVNAPGEKKPLKPQRPPPPKKKPRPFSIATDTINLNIGSNENSDSEDYDSLSTDHSFYESLEEPLSRSQIVDPIKHWDLPRFSHPEPIRRSLSDDCIPKAVDDAGNIVYFDPKKVATQDSTGYDIYVDSAGYAVPSRLVRRMHSVNDEETIVEPSRAIGQRVKSKFKKFKNLFSEADKSPNIDKSPTQGSTKRRLTIIRKKVEQAFEGLQGSRRKKRRESINDTDEETDPQPSTTEEIDSRVDEREIRKRVEYSRSVRLKTSASIKQSRKYTDKVYPQLFEYAMIVSLRQGDTGVYEPYVIYKFPEITESNVSVPQFCFPDAANFKPSSSNMKSQSYLFVLTNIDGGRVYGYCRRLIPPKSPNKVPEVICIISPVDAFYMYNTLLEEIENKRLLSLDLAQELIAAAFGRPLPSPGKESVVRTLDVHGEMETIFLTRETDSRIENVNCECLLTALGSDKVLKVFASILLERSVLFCAKHLSVLSSTIHALSSLLYPFSWQHTFIPVLPTAMLDVVCSPTPYIIGITSNHLLKALTLPLDENVLIVDLDKKTFVRSQGDEGTLLPKKIEKALKTVLNMCRIDTDAKSNPNLMISEAFLLFFVEAVGHYGQNIHTQQGGKKVFRKEEFIKGASSSSLEQLLEWFAETQMFEVFITKELEKTGWCNTLELFQSRVQDHKQSKASRVKWSRAGVKR